MRIGLAEHSEGPCAILGKTACTRLGIEPKHGEDAWIDVSSELRDTCVTRCVRVALMKVSANFVYLDPGTIGLLDADLHSPVLVKLSEWTMDLP